MRWALCAWLVALGCGRVGFDDLAAPTDASGTDTPAGACFRAAERLDSMANPAAIAVADLFGDNHADILVVSWGPNVFKLFSSTAAGIAPPVTYNIGTNPEDIRVGKLDADAFPDVVTANRGAGTVTIWLNNGTGTLTGRRDPQTGGDAYDLDITHLDAEGEPEIVVTTPTAGTVRVLDSDGTGTAMYTVDPATFPAGTNAESLATGDIDNDGNQDVVVVNRTSGGVSWLRGLGDSTFAPRVVTMGGGNPVHIDIADLDGDGFDDAVTVFPNGDNFSVFRGSASGLVPPTVHATGAAPTFVQLVDIDRDGLVDVVIAARDSDAVYVHRATAPGVFAAGVKYPTGLAPEALAVGDVDNDGALDIAVANTNNSFASLLRGVAGCD